MCRPLPSSFEQPCPMCRVFPHPRCPHNLETCRNRKNHPAFDVQYLTNAEVDWFNGCGFCKLSRTDPNAKSNQGWPGCCRPPIQTEFASIPIYVWRAVNIVHHVQVPPEIKALLDATRMTTPTGSLRGSRKAAPERKGSPTSRTAALPGKPRSGSSPHLSPASLSRSSSGTAHPASNGTPSRTKLPDFDVPRRSVTFRQTPPAASPPVVRKPLPVPVSPVIQPKPAPRPAERPLIRPKGREDGGLSSASSSSGSSDGAESMSDSTVVSDGGFTDYLSDESEAELQRQAEARAALLAQTQMEEMEFKAARLQLAHVDLRPPKTWSATPSRVVGK